MPFSVSPMFPGDLYDSMDRMGSTQEPTWSQNAASIGSAKWHQVLELGWQGVMVDECNGGVGATLVEFASIAEAAGRHAVTMPLTARCVVAPMLLAKSSNANARALLEQVASGRASVCPVMDSAPHTALKATPRGGGRLQLSGTLRGADLTEPASHLIVSTVSDGAGGPLLALVPTDVLGQDRRFFSGLDGRRTLDILVDGLVVECDHVLLTGPAVKAAVDDAMSAGAVMACVQTVGALGAMIEQTIEYLSTRTQFGVALSTFQALRHRVVEMYVAYESARGLVKQTTEELSLGRVTGLSRDRDAALTKLYLTTVGRMVAESAIQLHGGMGMTVEMPAARLAMHTLMCSLEYGDRLYYLDSLSSQMKVAASGACAPV